jgi:peptide/nickel transport system ATP-binding protein
VSVTAEKGEIVAVLGESGSGKTTLASFFAGTLSAGARIDYEQADLPQWPSLVEQEAHSSLHPLLRVGPQLLDCIREKNGLTGQSGKQTVYDLLWEVGLEPEKHYSRYPHQLSGGQAQRIAVARALAVGADMLIADEPTAHVDLIVQSKILGVLVHTVKTHNVACLFVTHDLSIAEEIASSIAVLYRGEIVEQGDPDRILNAPQKQYTRELVNSFLRETARDWTRGSP